MFALIFSFFNSFFAGLKTIWQAIWTFCFNAWVWVVGIVVTTITIATTVITFIHDVIVQLATYLGNIVLPSNDIRESVGDFLNVANHIFPVTEGFAILVALSALWIVCLFYRLIKSYVPTLA